MKRFLLKLYYVVMILFIGWFVLSYIDICAHNLGPDPQFSRWNMIIRFIEHFEAQ